MRRFEQYQDMIARIMPEAHTGYTDNGKRILSRTFTFKLTDDCNLACTYCVSGDTLIPMWDGSKKMIKDIQLGDKVIGFDEYPEDTKVIKLKSATVEQLFQRESDVIELNFSNESRLEITSNHKVLSSDGYVEAGDLKVNDIVYSLNGGHIEPAKITCINDNLGTIPVYNIGTSSHTYIANSIAVHNCYQSHKNAEHRMTWDVAKRAVDMLLTGENGMKDYIDPSYSPAIIIEFIGGEPFLEIDLMDKICDYFIRKAIEMQHPWAEWHMFSICSNGVLYFDDRVQRFLEKHKNKVSFSITIDGNKELHDSCRVFPDGRPSYDLAVAAAKDWMSRGYYMGSKITIAPGNVMHVADAIKHMVDLGYTEINANCVYEEGWNYSHATVLYQQMKELSDYFLENNFNFEREFFCSLWEENFFKPKDPDDNENWCFRAGTMILTPHGNVPIETIKVGDEVITGNGNVKHVENIMTHFADDPVLIIASDISPIWTTSNHPFLTRRENGFIEWVKAKDLKMTDCLKLYTTTKEQHWVGICELHTDDIKGYDVYNMTVSDDHTFVANGIVVHNCGGIGEMLAIDYAGRFFPCIRYMEDSLAGQQEPYSIGDLEHGVCVQQCDKDKLACLQCITRRSQSTDECFYCPIAEGCSWWIRPL